MDVNSKNTDKGGMKNQRNRKKKSKQNVSLCNHDPLD